MLTIKNIYIYLGTCSLPPSCPFLAFLAFHPSRFTRKFGRREIFTLSRRLKISRRLARLFAAWRTRGRAAHPPGAVWRPIFAQAASATPPDPARGSGEIRGTSRLRAGTAFSPTLPRPRETRRRPPAAPKHLPRPAVFAPGTRIRPNGRGNTL